MLADGVVGLLVLKVQLVQEFLGHRDEALLWPVLVPVDCCAVHQRGEHTDTGSEHLAYRRETEDDT